MNGRPRISEIQRKITILQLQDYILVDDKHRFITLFKSCQTLKQLRDSPQSEPAPNFRVLSSDSSPLSFPLCLLERKVTLIGPLVQDSRCLNPHGADYKSSSNETPFNPFSCKGACNHMSHLTANLGSAYSTKLLSSLP